VIGQSKMTMPCSVADQTQTGTQLRQSTVRRHSVSGRALQAGKDGWSDNGDQGQVHAGSALQQQRPTVGMPHMVCFDSPSTRRTFQGVPGQSKGLLVVEDGSMLWHDRESGWWWVVVGGGGGGACSAQPSCTVRAGGWMHACPLLRWNCVGSHSWCGRRGMDEPETLVPGMHGWVGA
jgi:hypothetical protein